MEEAEFNSKSPDFKPNTLLYNTAFDVLLKGVQHITHTDALLVNAQKTSSLKKATHNQQYQLILGFSPKDDWQQGQTKANTTGAMENAGKQE